jgi:hypothetical protein
MSTVDLSGLDVDGIAMVNDMMPVANDILGIFTPFIVIAGGVKFGAGLASSIGGILKSLI